MPRFRPALLAPLVALAVALGGCADAPPDLTGTWLPADTTAARYTFFADGRARIVLHAGDAPQVYEARYEVAGDTLLTLADDQGSERFRIRHDGDTLHLRSPTTGRATHVVRAR